MLRALGLNEWLFPDLMLVVGVLWTSLASFIIMFCGVFFYFLNLLKFFEWGYNNQGWESQSASQYDTTQEMMPTVTIVSQYSNSAINDTTINHVICQAEEYKRKSEELYINWLHSTVSSYRIWHLNWDKRCIILATCFFFIRTDGNLFIFTCEIIPLCCMFQ